MPDIPIDDPQPVPPVSPEPEDCCCSGCDPCVFDIYTEALARYREELHAWEQRRAAADQSKS